MKLSLISPLGSSLFPQMRNRLITVAVIGMASVAAEAAVIDFNNPNDIEKFNQTTADFWSIADGVGLNGSSGLVGKNLGQPAWLTFKTGFSPEATSVSGGVYFKLASSEAVASGYAMIFGVSGSSNYTPNFATVADSTKNHYLGAFQYNNSTSDRLFRVAAQTSTDGTYVTAPATYQSLSYNSWYYLSLNSTFDTTTSLYSVIVSLYSSSDAGVLGEAPIMTASIGEFALPALTDATENFFFFGLDGRAATRGVLAVDNFTYNVVPEPSMAGLVILTGVGVIGARGFLKK